MSLLKELLLLFITIVHMTLVASQPVELKICEKRNETENFNKNLKTFLNNLKAAESVYVKHIYNESSSSSQPVDGITFPAGNTTDPKTLYSLCAIDEYLKIHLPPMIGNLTLHDSTKKDIISNTTLFQFMIENLEKEIEKCEDEVKLKNCTITLPPLKHYGFKTYALWILRTAIKWIESYTNMLP